MRAICVLATLSAFAFTTGCKKPHGYVSALINEPIYDVQTESGSVLAVPNASSSSVIIGLAYWEPRDRLYARVAPGNRILELDRSTGRELRSFTAERVPAGCGMLVEIAPGESEVVPLEDDPEGAAVLTCGLAIRDSDGHLFLDVPNAASPQVVEIDQTGAHVKTIGIKPASPLRRAITGLGFHQTTNNLYVLYAINATVGEVTLAGTTVREFTLGNLGTGSSFVQPNSLDVDSKRGELLVPGMNGTALWVYDLSGRRLRTHDLGRSSAGFVGGGTGAGHRK